jgi:membrane protein implicated in regulation of membrane protease activity
MVWWLWVLLGIVLLVAETATAGAFFAFFFGVSAVFVGVLTALGVAGPAWVQWLLFSFMAVVALVTLRGPLQARLNVAGSTRPVDSLVGEVAVALGDLPPGGVGKAELRGTAWNARSAAVSPIVKGQRCVVEKVDGLTLWVRPE